jgi:hypothetical protein
MTEIEAGNQREHETPYRLHVASFADKISARQLRGGGGNIRLARASLPQMFYLVNCASIRTKSSRTIHNAGLLEVLQSKPV